MIKKLQNFVWFLIENIPSFLTVSFAAYVLLQSQSEDIEIPELLLWLVTLVGLLATSELIERLRSIRKIERLSQQTLQAIKEKEPQVLAENFFERGSHPLTEEATNYSELFISGMNLRRTATTNIGLFEQYLLKGASMKFLLVDPDSQAVPIIAKRNYVYSDPKELKKIIKSTLESLQKIGTGKDVKGALEIKILNYVPSYGITIIDSKNPAGSIWIDLYPFRVPPEDYPSFYIKPTPTGRWFGFFLNQFETMWEEAELIHSNKN